MKENSEFYEMVKVLTDIGIRSDIMETVEKLEKQTNRIDDPKILKKLKKAIKHLNFIVDNPWR